MVYSLVEGNLIYGIHYLFLAGSDSTSTTMRWAMLYMAVYPEIQGKIHKEIDEVIGTMYNSEISGKPRRLVTRPRILLYLVFL